jgi:hypothetical protein
MKDIITIDETWKTRNGRVFRLMRMQRADGTWTPWLAQATPFKQRPYVMLMPAANSLVDFTIDIA